MNVKGMEALRAFMEGGSLREAAERLHRTQPQVSRLLAALEDDVGFPLFDREKRRLVPTQEARELYASIENALLGLDEARHAARRLREHQHQHVRVLTAPHVHNALLADAIATVTAEFPGFSASIDSRSRLDIELWLGKFAFDLGITVLPVENPTLSVEPLVSVDIVAVMHRDHPLAEREAVHIDDLVGVPMIANARRTVMRQLLEAGFRKIGATPTVRLETPNGAVACELAARGLGIALADGFVARSNMRPGLVARRFIPRTTLGYVLMFPTAQKRTAAVDRLAELVRLTARREAAAPIENVGAAA